MDQVDFGHRGRNGFTAYNGCFQRYQYARHELKRPEAEWRKLVTKTETVLDFLIKEANKRGFDVDSILEIPSFGGHTCFNTASGCSEKILEYIIGRGIKVNCTTIEMLIPDSTYPDLAVPMMKAGINPYVINYEGNNQIDQFPHSFESEEAKQLLTQFPRSIHFSTDDISCKNTCPSDCPSTFKRFYFKNGEFVEMTDANRIGQGGFGCVFKGLFHGENKALKCVFIGNAIDRQVYVGDGVTDLEESISEIRIQIASGGSGVIVPEAFVRQQNQEQDENGKWIAQHYNIYIYPLYDCNLYELHENHYNRFTDEILRDIMHQCLTRKGLILKK